MRTARRLSLLCSLCALLLAPSAVLGATGSAVITDCNAHARLTSHYSLLQLRDALANLPPDVAAYTNCADVIQRQLASQLAGHNAGGGSGSGGSFLPAWAIVVLIVVILGGAGATVAARRHGPPRDDGEER